MNKRLVIAGAGGFGRGVYGWVTSSPRFLSENGVSEVAPLADSPSAVELPGTVVSTVSEYAPVESDRVLCAVGIIEVRKRMVRDLSSRGARFATFVDDRAVLCEGVRLGEGCIVCPGSVLSADVRLGRHVHVNFNCSIGHDTAIGDFSTLSPSVNVMGEVESGSAVFFGGSAAILPRLAVGSGAVIGAGAVVSRSVPDAQTVVGNPASALRKATPRA